MDDNGMGMETQLGIGWDGMRMGWMEMGMEV